MAYLIEQNRRKARKKHYCNLCRMGIEPGEIYLDQFCREGTEVYHFKMHEKCNFISSELSEYIDPYDGMTEDDFVEGVTNFCKSFICKSCDVYNRIYEECEEDNFPGCDCLEKVFNFLQKYEYYLNKNGNTYFDKHIRLRSNND